MKQLPEAWLVQCDDQGVALQMVEDHITEVQQLQHVAYRQDLGLQSLLKRFAQSLVVLEVSLQTSLCTVQALTCKLAGTIRAVGFVLDHKRPQRAFNWLLLFIYIARGNLADSEAEHSQQLFPEIRRWI